MSLLTNPRLTAQECADILTDTMNNNELHQGQAREELRRLLDDFPDRISREKWLNDTIGHEKVKELVPDYFIL